MVSILNHIKYKIKIGYHQNNTKYYILYEFNIEI